MFSRTESRNIGGGKPTPIKSSMSVILKNDQIWSNSTSDSSTTVTSRRAHGKQGPMMGSRGDFREWSANFSDISAFRNMDKETFDTFTERLVQRHTKKKRMSDRKTPHGASRNDRRTKKSRQIFTFSRPTNFQPGRPRNEGMEIYESSGGSVSNQEIAGMTLESRQPPQSFSPARSRPLRPEVPEVVPLPRVVPVSPENTRIDPYDSNSSCDTQIFFPERLLTPNHLPGTCFPRAKSQPDLYYSISDQSMPLKNYTSAHSFGDTIRKNRGLLNWQDDMYFVKTEAANCRNSSSKTNVPMCGINPSCMILEEELSQIRSAGLRPRKSLIIHPKEDQCTSEIKNSESIFLGCQELNDFLSKKMAKTLTGISILPTRGRLMSYAKFNSSFKISEDFYEGINRKSITRVPTMAQSLAALSFQGPDLSDKNLDYTHKLNPDFDENQSLTEALTTTIRSPYQSSSLTSVALRSELITKVYEHFAKSVNLEKSGRGEKFSWIRAPETVTRSEMALQLGKKQTEDEFIASSVVSQMDQKSGFADFSNDSVSCVSLSRVVSAIRKQRLTELKISLKNFRNRAQKETALWSSTTLSPVRSDPTEMSCGDRVSRKKLCDVISQTGVFNNSSADLFKRPFWRFKLSPVLDVGRTKLVQDFVSKAHHYMCGKDYHRTTLNRCYFRRTPTVRLSDQSTQFPDYTSKICDRPGEIEKPEDEEILSVEAATYCQIVHENCHVHENGERKHNSDHSLDGGFNFGCTGAFHCQTFETKTSDPSTRYGGCHKHVSSMSFTEINCVCPAGNATVYCTGSNKLVEEPQGLVHSETVYENIQADLHDQTSLLNHDLEGADAKPTHGPISHSFRALCDKRRIRIKYENGKYTVYKEVDRTRRRTVWSLLTGKATNLLSSVIPKKPPPKRSFRSHKACS